MEDVNMSQITKDTIIADILNIAPESAPLFMSIGMHCLGCAMANGETLGEACEVHGVDFDEFLEQLQAYVKE
jgi:hybrid cluster-associated redox disulfide protein